MDMSDIVVTWLAFLYIMHQIRVSGDKRPVFYLDETKHTLKYIWQDSKSNGGLKIAIGRGSSVGSTRTVFIPEDKWVFRLQLTKDCHEEMMADTFKDWFLNRFINI
jgi:hypothetical protein